MKTRPPTRDGYAMLSVLVFLSLMLMFFAVGQTYLGEALRVERARMQVRDRDEGSVHAMAAALDLLETGTPPGNPYICAVEIETSIGLRSFTVTYKSPGPDQWAISVGPTAPLDAPPPMPTTF